MCFVDKLAIELSHKWSINLQITCRFRSLYLSHKWSTNLQITCRFRPLYLLTLRCREVGCRGVPRQDRRSVVLHLPSSSCSACLNLLNQPIRCILITLVSIRCVWGRNRENTCREAGLDWALMLWRLSVIINLEKAKNLYVIHFRLSVHKCLALPKRRRKAPSYITKCHYEMHLEPG